MFSWNSYVQLEPGPYASRFQRSLSHDPHAIRHWKAREEQKRILASYSNIVVQTQAIASCRKNKNCILQHRAMYDDMHQWSKYCWHSTMDSFLSRRSPGILMQVRTCRELWRKKYRGVDCNIWQANNIIQLQQIHIYIYIEIPWRQLPSEIEPWKKKWVLMKAVHFWMGSWTLCLVPLKSTEMPTDPFRIKQVRGVRRIDRIVE